MPTTAERLISLAERYETAAFLDGDPSHFMHQFSGAADSELAAFIAASLSYGSRRQFMPKIQSLVDGIKRSEPQKDDGNVARWLLTRKYEDTVPPTPATFYRLYTCQTYHDFLSRLATLVARYGTLRDFLTREKSPRLTALEAMEALTAWFREGGSRGVIPQDTRSSCKRLAMFLRWMVRDGSPVDLGLWADIIDKATLIMPMDTHVVQEARRLGLLASTTTSMANALRLTARMAEVFPGDPLRADFALFGLGVDTGGK